RWLNAHIHSERAGRDQQRPGPDGSAQQNSTSGESGGLPRPGDTPGPDPSDDTAT
ncbi:PadR family transcriptional regulator, partial [Streptomyces sp. NPDC047868]